MPRTHRGIEDSPDRLLCRRRRCRVCRRASLSPIVDAQASTAAVDHARHPTSRFAGVVLLVSAAGRRDEHGKLRGRDPSPEPPETHLATTLTGHSRSHPSREPRSSERRDKRKTTPRVELGLSSPHRPERASVVLLSRQDRPLGRRAVHLRAIRPGGHLRRVELDQAVTTGVARSGDDRRLALDATASLAHAATRSRLLLRSKAGRKR